MEQETRENYHSRIWSRARFIHSFLLHCNDSFSRRGCNTLWPNTQQQIGCIRWNGTRIFVIFWYYFADNLTLLILIQNVSKLSQCKWTLYSMEIEKFHSTNKWKRPNNWKLFHATTYGNCIHSLWNIHQSTFAFPKISYILNYSKYFGYFDWESIVVSHLYCQIVMLKSEHSNRATDTLCSQSIPIFGSAHEWITSRSCAPLKQTITKTSNRMKCLLPRSM